MPARRLVTPLALLAHLLAAVPAFGQDRLVIAPTTVDDLKPVFATVDSVRTVEARTRIAGTLDRLAIREGDAVAAGQVVAIVTDPKLGLQRAALEARLDALAAQRRQAQLRARAHPPAPPHGGCHPGPAR